MPKSQTSPGKRRVAILMDTDLHALCLTLAARKRTNVTTEVIAALIAHLEAAGISTVKP